MQAAVMNSRQKWNSLIRLPMYVQEHMTHKGRMNSVRMTMR